MYKILFWLTAIIFISGCSNASNSPAPTEPFSFEEKLRQGKNTGTPMDMYNRNPYSVFEPYSPYNPFQNP